MLRKTLLASFFSCLCLLSIALLSACGTSASNNTSSAPSAQTGNTVAPTPTGNSQRAGNTPAPTTVPANTPLPTSTPADNGTYGHGVGSSQLTPYRGQGYTINFPGSWVITSDGSNGNLFSTPDKAASFHVFVQDQTAPMNPLQYEFGTLAKDNCKPTGNTSTVQLAGQSWEQSQFVCLPADNGTAGGKTEQIGILTSNDLHDNKYYSLDYIAEPANFSSVNHDFFQPMVTSFKLV